ncbi:hypothetical protein GSUB_11520 [Geoalkalibacter subterraneus]|uniref:Pentapeptide repeat-containing protein n=2 Tax=Geoalkalibacter subterraneus TaxID=483547 RepID=A0A0B5FSF4_9BACT|nr:hypothetical protein GSUB_11520 [Geoalkalibacter subterraneus]
MNVFDNDFRKNWQEYFSDVKKLNEYTNTNSVELKNLKVQDFDLEGVIFNGATFQGVTFENITAEHSKFRKTKFINCKFINCKFWEAEFTDTVFEDCEFIKSNFLQSIVINVKIINSKSIESEFDGLEGNELFIELSDFTRRSSFTDSRIPFKFKNTILSGVNMMGLDNLQSLVIEGGTLEEVNFGYSHFSDIILRRAKQGESPVRFNQASAKSITFEDVDMVRGVSLASVQAANVRISNSRMKVSFARSVIPKVSARDSEFFVFGLSEANMPHVTLVNSRIHYLSLWDGSAEEMIIQDSEINQIEGENFKGNHILWHNVTLDGEINLANAQVKDFRPTRLKRGPNLNLITTGSNLRFDFSAE